MTASQQPGPDGAPAVRLTGAALFVGGRLLWSELDLAVLPGEFVAVLGANGSGKTSLLRVLLGRQPLRAGTVEVLGRAPNGGSSGIGYVPQRAVGDAAGQIRARDLVRMGLDGERFGPRPPWSTAERLARERVSAALASVGATSFADEPIGMLSGGEFQRVRVAQAVVSEPRLLLCDEPLTALDVRHQQEIAALIDRQRWSADTAVLFVTHEINAVLPYADKVLYLANGRFRLGTPDEVITTESLSALYGSPVEVLRAGGRVAILAAASGDHHAIQADNPAGSDRRTAP